MVNVKQIRRVRDPSTTEMVEVRVKVPRSVVRDIDSLCVPEKIPGTSIELPPEFATRSDAVRKLLELGLLFFFRD